MIVRSDPAKIAGNFYCLGPAPVPSFLLDGEHPVMFEAGIYRFGPHYYDRIVKIMGERRPEYLFMTHVHFDHCGAAGYLKRMMPGLMIGTSIEGSEIIKKQSAVDLITKLNRFGKDDVPSFEPFTVDRVLEDGDEIRVSPGLTVRAIRTPGHTRDMTTYYIPEMKVMIPSESVGVPGRDDYIMSEFLIDYDTYMNSLRRLAGYEVDILIISHGLYYTGEDARAYIPRSIDATGRFREWLERLLREYDGDHEAVLCAIKREEYDVVEGEKQPESAYLLNLKAKISTIHRRMAVQTGAAG
ncbi:MAG TPA: MBL fold metallo-hydrolase [Spirochaetota bacterium]|nr:MBL fold metallo-hydrolase [Spirochaetota bacterium]